MSDGEASVWHVCPASVAVIDLYTYSKKFWATAQVDDAMSPHLSEFFAAQRPLEGGVARDLRKQRPALPDALLIPIFQHSVELDWMAEGRKIASAS
jgi:hypothetical protein